MEVLIIPVKETAAADFQKIYAGLRATGNHEYASFLNRNIQLAHVDEANPYVEVQFPAKKGAK